MSQVNLWMCLCLFLSSSSEILTKSTWYVCYVIMSRTLSQFLYRNTSLLLRRFVFLIVEASAKRVWLVMNRKRPWKGYRRRAKPIVSFPPSFARTFSSRERRLGTRQSQYHEFYQHKSAQTIRYQLFQKYKTYRLCIFESYNTSQFFKTREKYKLPGADVSLTNPFVFWRRYCLFNPTIHLARFNFWSKLIS